MYPMLSEEVLFAPVSQFRVALSERSKLLQQETATAFYHWSHRAELTKWIRRYYRNVDIDPSFPLLLRPGWRLQTPILLTPGVERKLLARLDNAAPITKLQPLPIGMRLHQLIEHADPRVKFKRGGSSYRLLNVAVNSDLPVLRFGLGSYLDFIDSCEVLGHEAAHHHAQSERAPPDTLPLRGTPDDVYVFSRRVAVAGVSTVLIARNTSRGDRFFYHQRSDKVAELREMLDVVPSCTFEPFAADDAFHERDFSIKATVLREFGEELLGYEESLGPFDLRGTSILDRPPLRLVSDALDDGKLAKLFFLGIGIDPLNTKPEILTCLILDYTKLSQKGFRIRQPGSWEGTVGEANLSKPQLERHGRLQNMAPGGAACLLLAAESLDVMLR
jgi:hypothetical protein